MSAKATLKRQLALALRYDKKQEPAPRVIAKGWGLQAERVMELAREHDIPLHQDDNLAESLARVELGAWIPEDLYEAVAEVLAFIYSMDQRLGSSSR